MKYQLGQKVIVNKKLSGGIRKGDIGIISKINHDNWNYIVAINSEDNEFYTNHYIAEEHLDPYIMNPKFKKGDYVRITTEYFKGRVWIVDGFLKCSDSYRLYEWNLKYNCITSTTINCIENKLEGYIMNKNQEIINKAKDMMKVIENFNREVNNAGGISWSIEHLEKVSGLDLLLHLAPNNVKMIYKP